MQARYVTRDVELRGTRVPEGSTLLLLNGSANRDAREFEDADRLDVKRRNIRHLSFGYGIHFCLGASLARLEGCVALEEVLARWTEWEIDHAGAEMARTSTVRGWKKLPARGRAALTTSGSSRRTAPSIEIADTAASSCRTRFGSIGSTARGLPRAGDDMSDKIAPVSGSTATPSKPPASTLAASRLPFDAIHRAPADFPSGKKGDVLTVEFTLAGRKFTGLNGGPHFTFTEAVSFQIFCDDQAEVDRLTARSRRCRRRSNAAG